MSALLEHFFGRKPDVGAVRAAAECKLAADAPLVAVLCTTSDDRAGWLAAGQALARLLLRARAAGIFASFFSPPVQHEPTREKLRQLVGGDAFPLVVLRMGFGTQPEAVTPRRGMELALAPSSGT